MEILDARGKTVNVGGMVRYNGTGTMGEVSAVKVENNEGWVKIDDSDLWYNSEHLQVLDKSKINAEKAEKDVLSKALEKNKKMKQTMENIDMSNELCDGGG